MRKLAAILEKFGARVVKPDAKPDAKQGEPPVSQPVAPVASSDSARFAASWQDYETALEARWGAPLAPVRPETAVRGREPAAVSGVADGEPG